MPRRAGLLFSVLHGGGSVSGLPVVAATRGFPEPAPFYSCAQISETKIIAPVFPSWFGSLLYGNAEGHGFSADGGLAMDRLPGAFRANSTYPSACCLCRRPLSPLDIPHDDGYSPLYITEEIGMSNSESSILQGTLDLMVLKTLEHLGPMHGYGIARRIEQAGERALIVNQGTVYLCLVRLVQKKWIRAEWGVSDNHRKAKFYSLTKAGRKQLQAETRNWERVAGVMGRVLHPQIGS
jgi:PadR family transcriptional regulator, regulatory protein PadR